MNDKAKDLTESNVTPIQQSPDRLLELAVQQNADVDRLEKLMELQERWNAQQAKAAFYDAISRFQQVAPRIEKTKHVSFPSKQGGKVDYWYAPLADIIQQIKQPLQECGLSYRWEFTDSQEWITATCILTHIAGHSESTQMTAPADESGGKNVIQQRGSTMQYLQRYTLIGVLGLTTADSDMDGRLPSDAVERVSEKQVNTLLDMVSATETDIAKFLRWLQVDSLENLPASQYDKAYKALKQKEKKHAD